MKICKVEYVMLLREKNQAVDYSAWRDFELFYSFKFTDFIQSKY